jgi:eukaryotic-like serine/threonine-protein kinase
MIVEAELPVSFATLYEPVVPIAAGGMGTVEVAIRRESNFQRLFALKRLHDHLREDSSFQAMFLDEARLAGLIRHPNVVSVLDVGHDQRGPFLAMEYVEGLSLALITSQLAREGEKLPLAMCVAVAAQAAKGLHAAHELVDAQGSPLGLVHRDVSPQNILVGFDGVVRVTDFGIARAVGNLNRTTTGILKGNLGYLPPEALRFEQLDRRSDLFALGVVLHELLRGRRLFAGSDAAAIARRVLHDPVPDVGDERPEAPPELVELLFQMLSKDPGHRPSTAAQVAARLEAVLHTLELFNEPFDIPGYMEATFGEQRARRAEEIAEGVRRLLAQAPGLTEKPAFPTKASPASHAAYGTDATSMPPGSRRGRRLGRAGVVVFAALVGAAAIGAAVILAPPRDNGLQGEYFDDKELTDRRLVRLDPEINFEWNVVTPAPEIAPETFSVRWTGHIDAPNPGPRRLCLLSDDGVRLWFDGRLVLDNWLVQWPAQACAAVEFLADRKHALKIEYFQNLGFAYVRLYWDSGPGATELSPVPSIHLYPP